MLMDLSAKPMHPSIRKSDSCETGGRGTKVAVSQFALILEFRSHPPVASSLMKPSMAGEQRILNDALYDIGCDRMFTVVRGLALLLRSK